MVVNILRILRFWGNIKPKSIFARSNKAAPAESYGMNRFIGNLNSMISQEGNYSNFNLQQREPDSWKTIVIYLICMC